MAIDKLLRFQELDPICGVRNRVTLSRLIRECNFPPPLKIGKRNVMWKQSEVIAWLQQRDRAEVV